MALVVIDVWMPRTSGLQVQARLQLVSPKTKVIVVTAQELPGMRATTFEGGTFAFLTKPFDEEAFLAFVHQALASAAQAD